jgi:hypothetical protein
MPGGVVATALPERYEKGFGDNIFRRARAKAAGCIPADAGRVPLKQQRERLGLGVRPDDDLPIGRIITDLSGFGDRQVHMVHAAIPSAGA